MWDTVKCPHICKNGVQKGEDRKEKEQKKYSKKQCLKILKFDFKKNINLHIQETQQTQNGITAKRFTARHIVVKILKAKGKEKISKAKRVGKSTHHIQQNSSKKNS